MTFYIENIKLEINTDAYGVQLEALDKAWPLPNQSLEETKRILTENFSMVCQKYLPHTTGIILPEDLHAVCLQIVVHYLYLYNMWRGLYEKEKNRDLAFLEKDYTHPDTYDMIIWFFKNKYPKDYADICSTMLGISSLEVLKFEADRHAFYASFR